MIVLAEWVVLVMIVAGIVAVISLGAMLYIIVLYKNFAEAQNYTIEAYAGHIKDYQKLTDEMLDTLKQLGE